jgi:hypothetical protein
MSIVTHNLERQMLDNADGRGEASRSLKWIQAFLRAVKGIVMKSHFIALFASVLTAASTAEAQYARQANAGVRVEQRFRLRLSARQAGDTRHDRWATEAAKNGR